MCSHRQAAAGRPASAPSTCFVLPMAGAWRDPVRGKSPHRASPEGAVVRAAQPPRRLSLGQAVGAGVKSTYIGRDLVAEWSGQGG